MKEKITVRRFQRRDGAAVQTIILRGLREVNSRDYSAAEIENFCAVFSLDFLLQQAQQTHFYVAEDAGGRILGTGAIAPLFGQKKESVIVGLYVMVEFLGKGIGSALLHALEADEFFVRADRVEVPSTITAFPFFERMGYSASREPATPNASGFIAMEKILIPDWEALAQLRQQKAHALIRQLEIAEAWSAVGKVHVTGALATGLLLHRHEIEVCIVSKELEIAGSMAVIARLLGDPSVRSMEFRSCCSAMQEPYFEFHLTVAEDQEEWTIVMRQIRCGTSLDGLAETQTRRLCKVLTPEMCRTILKLKFFMPDDTPIHNAAYCRAVIRNGISSFEDFQVWCQINFISDMQFWYP